MSSYPVSYLMGDLLFPRRVLWCGARRVSWLRASYSPAFPSAWGGQWLFPAFVPFTVAGQWRVHTSLPRACFLALL